METGSSTSSVSTNTHTLIDFDFETGSMVPLTAASPVFTVWRTTRRPISAILIIKHSFEMFFFHKNNSTVSTAGVKPLWPTVSDNHQHAHSVIWNAWRSFSERRQHRITQCTHSSDWWSSRPWKSLSHRRFVLQQSCFVSLATYSPNPVNNVYRSVWVVILLRFNYSSYKQWIHTNMCN